MSHRSADQRAANQAGKRQQDNKMERTRRILSFTRLLSLEGLRVTLKQGGHGRVGPSVSGGGSEPGSTETSASRIGWQLLASDVPLDSYPLQRRDWRHWLR